MVVSLYTLKQEEGKHMVINIVSIEFWNLLLTPLVSVRLLPPLMLESTPVWMSCSDRWLLALTATGLLYIW
jgi:hypothetical protein